MPNIWSEELAGISSAVGHNCLDQVTSEGLVTRQTNDRGCSAKKTIQRERRVDGLVSVGSIQGIVQCVIRRPCEE